MQEQQGLNPAQRELEGALKSLMPAAGQIDPIAAAFGAGRAAAQRQIRTWQSATGLLLLIAAGSWLFPASRRAVSPSPSFPGSTLAVTSQNPHPQPWSDQSVLMLQNTMWKNGIDALPSPDLPNVSPMHPDASL